jgi:hypothetical protein
MPISMVVGGMEKKEPREVESGILGSFKFLNRSPRRNEWLRDWQECCGGTSFSVLAAEMGWNHRTEERNQYLLAPSPVNSKVGEKNPK